MIEKIEKVCQQNELKSDYLTKIGLFFYRFIPPQLIINSHIKKLEKNKRRLEKIRNHVVLESYLISQKIANAEEVGNYGRILFERYDFMLDEMTSTRDEKREELMKARSEAAKNPGNGYHSIEKEVRAIDTDRRNIKMKQARAAKEIIMRDIRVEKYKEFLEMTNIVLQKSEESYFQTEIKVMGVKAMMKEGVPARSIVQKMYNNDGKNKSEDTLEDLEKKYLWKILKKNQYILHTEILGVV